MTEPLKNYFNEQVIASIAANFIKSWPEFDAQSFKAESINNFQNLELKQRSAQITRVMKKYLPEKFDDAAQIILHSLPQINWPVEKNNLPSQGIAGWAIMPMVDFVGLYGLQSFDLSMRLFKELTKQFSSEYGIRNFLIAEPERTLSVLKNWVNDENYHVRRLVSEGTRPRLPWAMGLPEFVKNPEAILPLLEALKDDESEYVRRSVANNLNDIAKDHPELIATIAKQWLRDADINRQRLVKHACRTLIKKGHKNTLAALGYRDPDLIIEKFDIACPRVKFGDALLFEMEVISTSGKHQALVIDYAIHYQKANGSLSAKVFKWKNISLKPFQKFNLTKKHVIKKITTRTYYPGQHKLEILINGQSLASKDFVLIM